MGSGYKAQREGIDAIVQQFKDIRRAQQQLNARITALGVQIDADGNMTIGTGQTLTVDGDLDVTGDSLFSGNTLIQGNLAVPNGSITNDALRSPLAIASDFEVGTNFAVSKTGTVAVSISIPIPSGFTGALVDVVATVSAYNAGSADNFYVTAKYNVAGGGSGSNFVGSSGGDSVFCAAQVGGVADLSLAPSDGLPFQCIVHTDNNNWAAQGANVAWLKGTAIFTR